MTFELLNKIISDYSNKLVEKNYNLTRKDIVDVNLYKVYNYVNKTFYSSGLELSHNELYIKCSEFLQTVPIDYIHDCKCYCNNLYSKNIRISKRIEILLQKKCIFLTLTFTDEVLKNTDEEKRRRYVREFLKSYSDGYIANIDFGARDIYIDDYGNERLATHREHYHAIIQSNYIDYSLWSYGAINGEVINKRLENCPYKLSIYINKLVNHSLKDSTKRKHLIYSKIKKQ